MSVLLSIGGWNDSQHFPAIAADPVKRGNFAHHCGLLVMEYGFDGIDIDWEYPGYAPNGGTPADKVNFSLLTGQIRDTLDAKESLAGHALCLTSCFSANAANMDNIEWLQVMPDLHSANLMSYDFFGSWDPVTNHNAPLYTPAQGDPAFNLDSAVQQLLQVHQVPASKINAGLAFYGRSVKTQGPPALFGPSLMQADQSTFWEDAGTPLYYNILAKMNLFTPMTDPQARVPYLTGNGALNTFVSYDDEASIAEKAAYIVANGLRGAIIWELTGDYLETSPGSGLIAGTPLADTLNAVFCIATAVKPVTETGTTAPFRLIGQSLVPADWSRPWSLTIHSNNGRMAWSQICTGMIDLGNLNLREGLYLISLRQGKRYQTLKWVKML